MAILLPPVETRVRPDAGARVARAGGEITAVRSGHGAGGHRDDRVLVALQHELRVTGAGIPELHTAILGTGENPFRVGGEGNTEHKVLDVGYNALAGQVSRLRSEQVKTYPVSLKGLDAAAALERRLLGVAHLLARRGELPHLDSLVQATTNELAGVGRERNTINAVLVSVRALEALEEVAHLDVPNPHTLIQRSGSHKLGIGGDGNRGDAVLNGERQVAIACLQIPDPHGPVTTSRRNGAAITGKVERVNVLVVAGKGGSDLPGRNIPDLKWRHKVRY